MSESIRRKVWLGVALFVFWTLIGLFMFSQALTQKLLSHDPHTGTDYFLSWMVGVWLWCAFTPLLLWLGRRVPIDRKPYWRGVLSHLAISLLFPFVDLVAEAVILRTLHLFPDIMVSIPGTLIFLLVIGYHQSVMTYWTVLAAQCAYGWYRRYEERRREALRLELRSSQLERQLAEAHLSALKMQLHPHFLFNTLNTIMVLVRQQKGREAEEMLSRLSDLLRCVLEDVQAQEVPLARELEYLQLYLSIEQVRFQDRLHVEVAADPEVLDAALPHMALQPIVENAIRHGIGRSSTAGAISITACRVNQSVEIKIQDDGPGLAPANGGGGIGLANTRARLRELYGDAASLGVENGEGGGVVATMVLPFHVVMETHGAHRTAGG
ncbi:MAG TPA: histidine kinase [Bryobacteraceae bacterium]|jgi:signal transduction histidine kinase|nr:histidine kinase [Bryobacteraceae bacterium]